MNIMFVLLFGAVGMLLALLFWALRPRRDHQAGGPNIGSTEEPPRQPATYFGVIRQAMSGEDFEFLAARAPMRLVRRAHKERQRIAMLYLADLRADFQRLLRLARVIAVLSPEVAASHEFERLQLSMRFSWRYRMVLLGLYAGLLFLPQLNGLSQMVSELAFRLESAMKELGERAAVAAELASTLNRRGLDMA
ncbi:MAG TPA: hypothetical protein VN943_12315 [Candidatus Acidoferrum sp.]|nr:hypothetical protein [Candidatus Acidoferrum sp.]